MLGLWLVALRGLEGAEGRFRSIEARGLKGMYSNGTSLVQELRTKIDTFVWEHVPKGVDASKGLQIWNDTLNILGQSYDSVKIDTSNTSAKDQLSSSFATAETVAIQTLFDSLSISVPKDEDAKTAKSKSFDKEALLTKYEERFKLVFDYVYISVCETFLSPKRKDY